MVAVALECSIDVKRAFENISPESLNMVMKEMDMTPMLAGAILWEQSGGRYDICFQGNKGERDTLW